MGRARAIVARLSAALLALLPACEGAVCETERLAPPTAAPAWAVRFNGRPTFEPPPEIPGEEPIVDPPGIDDYASYTLYDADGAAVAERWLDTLTRWEGATGEVSAASSAATVSPGGRLTLLLADGRRPAVSFSLTDGSVGPEVPAFTAPPDAGGQLVDYVAVRDRLALASRRRTGEGGGDLLLLDPSAQLTLRVLTLDRISTGPVEPGRIAPLSAERYVVGLTLDAEPERGAVAIVDASTETVVALELTGLRDCWHAAAMPPDPAAPDVARVAVLCRGDLGAPAETRPGVGFAIVAAAADEPPSVALSRVGDPALLRYPPTGRVVPLLDGWVAVRSAGDLGVARDDALVALDLDGAGVEVLTQAPFDTRWGASLGDGDFGGGELWWPTVPGGVLRWRVEPNGDDLSFTALPIAAPPGCEATPARDIRYLPAP